MLPSLIQWGDAPRVLKIMVTINGQALNVAGMTVADYLLENGFTQGRVALELNGQVLSSALFAQYRFKDGDRVEIVHFVGGG